VYLDEEVTDQVTSSQKDLKAEPHLAGGEDGKGFGLENATLKWNEVDDVEKQKDQDKTKNGVLSPNASSPPMTMLKPPPVTLDHCWRPTSFVIQQFGFQRDSCPSSLNLLHPGKRLFLYLIVSLSCRPCLNRSFGT
jgi:hypothetical protein